ncbi:DHA2 family efflux MFS transporter permease subunit [Actinacidiphila rubida]|uniref:Drug resistance transporter, EmrB/QacA subfamily n=1 Tax=Actinacidiphila rubida TaxID=310780 RepID=A0A1H8GGB5_9ACTN|nr:DHA2 family efflux MFS transporter permease subunit [Actinacidiphila rubida]SEN42527.1 drug resistance transporter, EmrB/QacA subfamily [Actinacidiphila rubida]
MPQPLPEPLAAPAPRSPGAALAVLSAGTLMIILDGTIVNVALPSIQRDLGFSQAGLAWVVNAYLIAFGGLLLLTGRIGDLLGRRRLLVAGLTAFSAASLLCGIADSAGLLIAARFVQGAAGAMVSAVALGMVIALYPEPRGRARAMGVYSFTQSAGGVLGLLLGGILTQAVNWHWIFFVNLPIGAAAALLSLRLLPDDRPNGRTGRARSLRGADAPGAVLVTAALMLGVATIVRTADLGWTAASTAITGALSLVLLAAFLLRQATAAQPLLPLRLFRSRIVSGANLVQALMVAAGFGFQFLSALYLQRVLGYDPLEIGLAIAPTGLVIGVMSLALSARLGARFGQRAVLLPSLALFASGFLLLARAPSAHASYAVDILPAILVFGVGFGLAMPSLMTLGMSDATPADSGLVSGVFNTAQQIGGALGLAVLASLAGARTDHRLAAGAPLPQALTSGYHLAFLTAAGLLAAATVIAAALLRPPARPADGRTGGHGPAVRGPVDRTLSASPGNPPAPGPTDRTARV